MDLNALLASPIVLPSIPKVIALLLSELDRPEPDLKNITQLISTDPVLTTRVLQMGNAAPFRLSGKINSATEALAILELSHIRELTTQAASSASMRGIPGVNLPQFWAYSLNVARLARSLAGLTRQNQGAAFTSGLIHAIGELVMHAGMPQEMAFLNKELGALDLKRAKAEFFSFGYCYAQVGAGYGRQWNFPPSIVDALEHQYAPFSNNVYEPLAGVIHLASWRARAKLANLSDKALAVTFPSEVGDVLGLDMDMVLQQDPFDWAAYT